MANLLYCVRLIYLFGSLFGFFLRNLIHAIITRYSFYLAWGASGSAIGPKYALLLRLTVVCTDGLIEETLDNVLVITNHQLFFARMWIVLQRDFCKTQTMDFQFVFFVGYVFYRVDPYLLRIWHKLFPFPLIFKRKGDIFIFNLKLKAKFDLCHIQVFYDKMPKKHRVHLNK